MLLVRNSTKADNIEDWLEGANPTEFFKGNFRTSKRTEIGIGIYSYKSPYAGLRYFITIEKYKRRVIPFIWDKTMFLLDPSYPGNPIHVGDFDFYDALIRYPKHFTASIRSICIDNGVPAEKINEIIDILQNIDDYGPNADTREVI